jgi:hypothetical protein
MKYPSLWVYQRALPTPTKQKTQLILVNFMHVMKELKRRSDSPNNLEGAIRQFHLIILSYSVFGEIQIIQL